MLKLNVMDYQKLINKHKHKINNQNNKIYTNI